MNKIKGAVIRWGIGIVLAILGIIFICNIDLVMEPLLQLKENQSELSEIPEDEMLSEADIKRDMRNQAAAIGDLEDYLAEKEIPFLYVQVPYKEKAEGELLPEGMVSYANQNQAELLDYLESMQVETLELSSQMSATKELTNKYFYKTDHYWNNYGAFFAFQIICDRIANMFSEKEFDFSYTDMAEWESHTLKNWLFGTGPGYTKTDDFTWYTPKFETDMSYAVSTKRQLLFGDFETVIMREPYVEVKNCFEPAFYVTYIGDDYPVVQHRNRAPVSDLKLLIIKDSYTLPVQAYLSTVFREIDVLDPRLTMDCTVAEYIAGTEPDLVVLMLSPSAIGTEPYLDFGVEEARSQGTRKEQPLWQKDIEVKPSETNAYCYSYVKAEYGKTYTVSFDDVLFTQGEAEGVVMGLYNQTSKKLLSTAVFDLAYGRQQGEFSWSFSTPDEGADNLLLIFYAGMPGETKNIGVQYQNVTLYEWE